MTDWKEKSRMPFNQEILSKHKKDDGPYHQFTTHTSVVRPRTFSEMKTDNPS